MIFKKKSLLITLTAVAVAAAVAAFLFLSSPKAPENPRYKWYENVMMYHVFVKSFADSNGDGKGDLKGLISKLDYIQELGVNTIYMLPITPALNNPDMPRSHYGYEITDFKNIHPDYGTLEDFRTLVREAHKRGIRIVLDFITTVISVQHPFFQDVLNNPDSKYKDWIINSPTPPDGQWMNFNDYSEQFKSSAWNPLPHGGYYYSLWGSSPFLNYHNPEVREYMISVIDFWLDMGADGFRIDASKHLFINGPGEDKQYHQPENFEFWRKLRQHINEKYGPDKTLIAEVIPVPNDIRYVEPDRASFDSMFDSTFINDVYPYIATDLDLLYSAPFLHSFFDNENVFKITKLQDRLTYHSDHDGVRLAARLQNGTPEQLKLAAAVLLLTPAHIKLYAGDEIGIKGFSDFADFKNKWFHATLASMAWDDSKNGGFTTSDHPVIPITDDFREYNVKAQEKDPDSILNQYRRLIALKTSYPQFFFKGTRRSLETPDDKIYAYFLNNGDETALVVMNLSNRPKDFELNVEKYSPGSAHLIFGQEDKVRFEQDGKTVALKNMPGYSTYVLQFDAFDFSSLSNIRPGKRPVVFLAADGTEHTAAEPAVFRLELPEQGAVLRLFKGQGKVGLITYEYYGENEFATTFKDEFDTSAGDVLVPVFPGRSNAVIFPVPGTRFALEKTAPASVFDGKVSKKAEAPQNVNLRAFHAGKDDNFWYFKVDRKDYALPMNGGLDFALLINNGPHSQGTEELSFWRLPFVQSNLPIDGFILYERHIQTARIQTGINRMRFMGINIPDKLIAFETPDAFYAMVARTLLPLDRYNIAPIVWSANGNWGDTPPDGKPVPIVERLPFNPNKTYEPSGVSNYLTVE
ncbi:MAG: alpha-amylase family glycosyl hydrolase [Alphaproteobacteria bacterium]